MDDFTIKVMIAGRPYRLTIDRKNEELILNAANQLEAKMKDYAADYAFKDQQDLLAMVALQFATSTLTFEKLALDTEYQIIEKLETVDSILTDTLK